MREKQSITNQLGGAKLIPVNLFSIFLKQFFMTGLIRYFVVDRQIACTVCYQKTHLMHSKNALDDCLLIAFICNQSRVLPESI